MTTSLLAYIPSPAQGVWHLGPVPIRAYALCIITGIIAALIIGDRRWVARGGEQGVIYDIALWTVPFGLVGGRLYHLMTDWRTYFAEGGAGIAGAVRIWDGGLGIWGAVALGGVGAWIGCRRHGIPLPAFGDAVAPGVILAQAIGRLGNYFNQELYGRPTDLPWGLQIFQRSDGSGVVNPHLLNGVSTGQVYDVVHPTFLYELLWNLLVLFLLLWADRRFKLGHGRLFALYVAAYCVGRFGVELMRSDTATLIAGIRVNSFTSTFVFIGAVVYMMVAPRGREDPATLGGRHADEAEAEADVEAEGALLAVPVAVAAGAAVGGEDDAEEVADEADAVETQPDETVALAEQAVDAEESADEAEDAVDEDAADAEAAVEESVDESVEKPVDADEVEDEDESDTEAEELAADEDEAADETGVVDPEAEAAESDDSDAVESEDAAVAEDVVAEDEAVEAETAEDSGEDADEDADEAAEEADSADEPAADEEPEADADGEDGADESEEVADEAAEEADSDDEPADEPVEEAEPKVAATEKVEPVGVPVWEPPAPRRRWWRRQG
ncbi:prolipoprotein diacylglyceryl transferase [Mycolicibacterium llatzerense]|uniref:Phosphatidylglycerol--prolipoprotein diacylglyceryl transferase n=1 Tax=Mycolicibacterium llatzerense TaxID=280871 RepID=A0A0D1LDH3_9MYCO|nr:prolipoprotein diacylglyceryl transferase [Mycolicibacterium llatzerense]KIU16412.1 diacylglyceryl transferase [Mycolicibacterium llatzerense]